MTCLSPKIKGTKARLKARIDRIGAGITCSISQVNDVICPSVSLLGELLSCIIERIPSLVNISCERLGAPLQPNISVVCNVDASEQGYELFLTQEGIFILADSQIFKVAKNELSK